MPAKKQKAESPTVVINVFDGTRQPISSAVRLHLHVFDGFLKQQFSGFRKGPSIELTLPIFDNLGDRYTISVSADDYLQAGFTPVKVLRNTPQHLDLMLLPRDGTFNFKDASWQDLQASNSALVSLLSQGADSSQAAKDCYEQLMEEDPEILAAFFNITTAMATIHLPSGTPLDYCKQLVWEDMAQDRFFAYADKQLIDQVERAVLEDAFRPEPGAAIFHPGATRSYKEIRFGEANVQLTFHEKATRKIEGTKCVKVEVDIDYHRDILAHALLELIPNTLSGGLTDPRQVYVLRWIAGKHANVPEFNPPYTIV
jgi:hypothetical protein